MNEVFVDAYYWIAMLNPNDRHHAAALKQSASLKRRAVTTIWTLMETADALSAPSLRRRVHQFLTNLDAYPKLTVISDLQPWRSGRGNRGPPSPHPQPSAAFSSTPAPPKKYCTSEQSHPLAPQPLTAQLTAHPQTPTVDFSENLSK